MRRKLGGIGVGVSRAAVVEPSALVVRLRASVPEELPAGPVRLIVFLSEEDEAGAVWAHGAAREWADELRDSRQDLYTLADGQRIDAAR